MVLPKSTLALIGVLVCGSIPDRSGVLAAAPPQPHLAPRDGTNPCDGAPFAMYQDYREAECRAPKRVVGGECTEPGDACISFCQQVTIYRYATEHPFPGSYCHGHRQCAIANNPELNVSHPNSVDFNLVPALQAGVSGGWQGLATGKGYGGDMQLEVLEGECGYYTFLPVVKRVWYEKKCAVADPYSPSGCRRFACVNPETETDYCVEELWSILAPRIAGDVVWVNVNCTDRTPLPWLSQWDKYAHESVAMPGDQLQYLLDDNVQGECRIVQRHADGTLGFRLTGRGNSDLHIGLDGQRLLESLSACSGSAAAGWRFTRPGPDDMDWEAHVGLTPAGGLNLPQCVGVVFASIGGWQRGDCHA